MSDITGVYYVHGRMQLTCGQYYRFICVYIIGNHWCASDITDYRCLLCILQAGGCR